MTPADSTKVTSATGTTGKALIDLNTTSGASATDRQTAVDNFKKTLI